MAADSQEYGIIDLVTHDPKTDTVVLIIAQTAPCNGSGQQLRQLQDKINTYLSFVLDGALAERYPAMAGKPVRIRLDCHGGPPTGEAVRFLEQVSELLKRDYGIGFEVEVSAPAQSDSGPFWRRWLQRGGR